MHQSLLLNHDLPDETHLSNFFTTASTHEIRDHVKFPEYSACSSRRHRKECVTALRVCLIFSVGCHREPENGDLYAVFAFSRHQLYDVSHTRFTRLRKKCHNCAIAFGVGWRMGTTLINLTKLAICLIRQGPWLRLRAICLIRHGPWLQLRYVSNHRHLSSLAISIQHLHEV